MKPMSFTRAKVDSDTIRPMFGPSGVSIGQIGRSASGARREPRSRPLTRGPRARGREAALVRDRRQRIRLVHELRELARPEELLDDRRDRLGVDQIVGHQRLDLLEAHALLDRSLHADQTDPVLVLEQLADDPHAAFPR